MLDFVPYVNDLCSVLVKLRIGLHEPSTGRTFLIHFQENEVTGTDFSPNNAITIRAKRKKDSGLEYYIDNNSECVFE